MLPFSVKRIQIRMLLFVFYSLEFSHPVLVCLLDCLCFVFLFFYSCKKIYEKQNLKSDQGYRRFLFSFIKKKKIPKEEETLSATGIPNEPRRE